MKKLFILLIATISYFHSPAQDCLCLPESVVTNIIDELIIKDGWEYELTKKDSIITAYERDSERNKQTVAVLKLTAEQYKTIAENNSLLLAYCAAEKKDLKKELRTAKIKIILQRIVIVVEAAVIVLLIISTNG